MARHNPTAFILGSVCCGDRNLPVLQCVCRTAKESSPLCSANVPAIVGAAAVGFFLLLPVDPTRSAPSAIQTAFFPSCSDLLRANGLRSAWSIVLWQTTEKSCLWIRPQNTSWKNVEWCFPESKPCLAFSSLRYSTRDSPKTIDNGTAASFVLDHPDSLCRCSRDDASRSSSPDRPDGGYPSLHRIEHDVIALKHVSSEYKHLPGNLSHRAHYHRKHRVQFGYSCRTFAFVFLLWILVPYLKKSGRRSLRTKLRIAKGL